MNLAVYLNVLLQGIFICTFVSDTIGTEEGLIGHKTPGATLIKAKGSDGFTFSVSKRHARIKTGYPFDEEDIRRSNKKLLKRIRSKLSRSREDEDYEKSNKKLNKRVGLHSKHSKGRADEDYIIKKSKKHSRRKYKEERYDFVRVRPTDHLASFEGTGIETDVDFPSTKPGNVKPRGPIAIKEQVQRKFGLRFTDKPQENVRWREPSLLTNCWVQAMLSTRYNFSPSCNNDGSFGPKQCFLQRCWCVNTDGSPQVRKTSTRFHYNVEGVMLQCKQNG